MHTPLVSSYLSILLYVSNKKAAAGCMLQAAAAAAAAPATAVLWINHVSKQFGERRCRLYHEHTETPVMDA